MTKSMSAAFEWGVFKLLLELEALRDLIDLINCEFF